MNGNPFYEPYWDTELEHHGVKNMKWGVKNGPPYPLDKGKDGRVTKTQKKKKASFLARLRGGEKKKETKKKEDDIPRSKKEQEKIRKKALASTDPKYIYKYRKLLSDNELQDRINRINKEETIKKLIPKEKEKNQKFEDAKKFLQTSAAMAESVTKIYNTYNTITLQQQNRADRLDQLRMQREQREEQRRQRQNQNNSSN